VSRPAPARGVNVFDDSRPMWQHFLVFLIPLVASNVLQSIYGTLNSIFLGRLIGVNALAAVSAFFPILFLLISFFIGLSSGSTVLVGQAFGAGDAAKMKKIAGTTISVALLLGVGLSVLGWFFTGAIMQALHTPPDIIGASEAYARVVFVAMPLIFVFFAYVSFLRGTGDSRTPLWALAFSTALGMIVTPALIRGWFGLPQLGVVSAAVASIVANGGGLTATLLYLRAIKHPLSFDRETARDLLIDPKLLRTIVSIGVPTGVQVIMVSLAEIAVLSFVNHFGSRATAAYGAVNQVVSYVQFPAISIGITASIFGAQSIGAGRTDRLPLVVHAGIGLNYVLGGTLIALCYALAYPILRLFIIEPNTLAIAHGLLMITLWSYPLYGNAAVLSGVMRSSGTVLVPTTIGVLAIWGVEVPVAWILMHRIGLNGIWFGYPASFIAMLSLQTLYYRLVWKHKKLSKLV